MKRRVLVVDVGGTYVKLLRSSRDEREFPSGPRLKPQQLVAKLKETARGWKFDRASIGFPAPVRKGRIVRDPKHLGKGWVGFNFARALGIPVRVINDAALQALGSYRGGRMLFLGLGTGLGSALVWDKTLMPLELGDLPYRHGHIIEDYLGIPGLALLGEKKWKQEVAYAVTQLRKSFVADYVVLGGGLVLLDRRPGLAGVLLGLLAYKPQFGLLVPLVLLIGGHWRATILAALTVIVMVSVSWALLGSETWYAFIASLAHTKGFLLEQGAPGWAKLQSTFAAVRLLGGSIATAYAAQALVAALATAAVVWAWRQPVELALKSAALVTATVMVTPFVLDYDLIVLALPIAWMSAAALRHCITPATTFRWRRAASGLTKVRR